VHRVPAAGQGERMHPELAGMKQPQHLDLSEGGPTQRLELVGAVFLDVPRVVGLLGACRGQREQVRGRDVGNPAGGQQSAEVLEHGDRVLDVLDRLQEHDGVKTAPPALAERLHQPSLETQVLTAIAQAGVLVGLGVGVDPDDAGRPAGQDLGPVPLAARHIEHPAADHPGADPLVDRQMSPVPVVFGGHVGQRSLAGEGQGRDPGRLVTLNVGVHGHGATG
jgi:hypothetical protein